jgi:hypothetical protein
MKSSHVTVARELRLETARLQNIRKYNEMFTCSPNITKAYEVLAYLRARLNSYYLKL